jgi:hypothetical protein
VLLLHSPPPSLNRVAWADARCTCIAAACVDSEESGDLTD